MIRIGDLYIVIERNIARMRRARPAFLEAKHALIAGVHDDSQTLEVQQDIGDELLRRKPGQRPVEIHHNKAVQTERLHERRAQLEAGQSEERTFRLEEGPGMGVENHGRRRPPQRGRRLIGQPQNRLVPAMDAVEIADGDRSAPAGFRSVRSVA